MPTFYSPSGNAEVWEEKPEGYMTPEEWKEQHPDPVYVTYYDKQGKTIAVEQGEDIPDGYMTLDEYRALPEVIEAAKTAKKAAIDKRTDELNLTQGMTYDGKNFSMSPAAKINWTGMLSLMTAGMMQYPFAILTVNDEPYMLKDQQAMQSFLMTVMQYDANPESATGKGRVLRGQVEACTTVEEVEAITDDR